MASVPQVTQLLQRLAQDDPRSEEQLFQAVYDDLREMARRQLSRERAAHTFRSTDLVHEGFVKMRRDIDAVGWEWNSRKQFYHIAARAMRQILVEYARKRSRLKRGGDAPHLSIDAEPISGELAEGLALYPEADAADEQLRLDDALHAFEAERPEDCKMFLMSYYAACSQAEVAGAFGVSERTVRRRLTHAKARLADLMGRPAPSDD